MPNENVSLSSLAILLVGNGSRSLRVRVRGLSGPQRGTKVGANMKVECRVLARGPGQEEWAGGLPWEGAENRAGKARTSRKSCG